MGSGVVTVKVVSELSHCFKPISLGDYCYMVAQSIAVRLEYKKRCLSIS
ncbi:hypothetical protein HanRHA438_Chr08g0358531 [Helianthus annuus]|nr:hypothetical protein HanRHA438_Chr08g0358531 [Helianthus annuus]